MERPTGIGNPVDIRCIGSRFPVHLEGQHIPSVFFQTTETDITGLPIVPVTRPNGATDMGGVSIIVIIGKHQARIGRTSPTLVAKNDLVRVGGIRLIPETEGSALIRSQRIQHVSAPQRDAFSTLNTDGSALKHTRLIAKGRFCGSFRIGIRCIRQVVLKAHVYKQAVPHAVWQRGRRIQRHRLGGLRLLNEVLQFADIFLDCLVRCGSHAGFHRLDLLGQTACPGLTEGNRVHSILARFRLCHQRLCLGQNVL